METQTSDIPDILTNDVANYSSAMPLLPMDSYTLKVKKVELAKSAKGGQLVKIKLETTEPHTAANGKENIKAGWPIFDQISLETSDNYPRESIERRIKTFRKAATGQDSGAFFPLSQYEGATVRAKVKIQAAKDGFDERNAIGSYEMPK